MNNDVITAIHNFASEMMRLTGKQPSSMELPRALYDALAKNVNTYFSYPTDLSSKLQLYTSGGPITFTKKTCKECGHDI